MLKIRREEKSDFRTVEELTREAFWNHHVPGCDEHYFAHILRTAPDFIPALDFVAVLDDKIVGNIMYTKSAIKEKSGDEFSTITFGPISVLPEFQKQGIGAALIHHSFDEARKLGHKAVIIYGFPAYYSRFGFEPCIKYQITNIEGKSPKAMQVCELEKGCLKHVSGIFLESPIFVVDADAAEHFDKTFPAKEKKSGVGVQALFKEMSAAYWDYTPLN
jgi:predicted N-acetyltransferase YhbS